MDNVSNGSTTESVESGNGASSTSGKRPKKGILKTSHSFDRSGASSRKSAKFDELNVLQTFHPADKDYGHMKIDEPKTPYNLVDADPQRNHLDAELLAEKLRIAANNQARSFDDDEDDNDLEETPEEKAHRLEFERRRKAHYKEFEAVKLARKLIEEELVDDGDDDDGVNDANKATNSAKSQLSNRTEQQNSDLSVNVRRMDIDSK